MGEFLRAMMGSLPTPPMDTPIPMDCVPAESEIASPLHGDDDNVGCGTVAAIAPAKSPSPLISPPAAAFPLDQAARVCPSSDSVEHSGNKASKKGGTVKRRRKSVKGDANLQDGGNASTEPPGAPGVAVKRRKRSTKATPGSGSDPAAPNAPTQSGRGRGGRGGKSGSKGRKPVASGNASGCDDLAGGGQAPSESTSVTVATESLAPGSTPRPAKRAAAVTSRARTCHLQDQPSSDPLSAEPVVPSTLAETIPVQGLVLADLGSDAAIDAEREVAEDDPVRRGDACALCLRGESQTALLPGFRDWVGCDLCFRWIHAACLHTSMADIQRLAKFACPFCVGERSLLSVCDLYADPHLGGSSDLSCSSSTSGGFPSTTRLADRLAFASTSNQSQSLSSQPAQSHGNAGDSALRGPALARVINARMRTIFVAHSDSKVMDDPLVHAMKILKEVISPPVATPPPRDDNFRFNDVPSWLPFASDAFGGDPSLRLENDHLGPRWWGSSALVRWYQSRSTHRPVSNLPFCTDAGTYGSDSCAQLPCYSVPWAAHTSQAAYGPQERHTTPPSHIYPPSPRSAAVSTVSSPQGAYGRYDLQVPFELHQPIAASVADSQSTPTSAAQASASEDRSTLWSPQHICGSCGTATGPCGCGYSRHGTPMMPTPSLTPAPPHAPLSPVKGVTTVARSVPHTLGTIETQMGMQVVASSAAMLCSQPVLVPTTAAGAGGVSSADIHSVTLKLTMKHPLPDAPSGAMPALLTALPELPWACAQGAAVLPPSHPSLTPSRHIPAAAATRS